MIENRLEVTKARDVMPLCSNVSFVIIRYSNSETGIVECLKYCDKAGMR